MEPEKQDPGLMTQVSWRDYVDTRLEAIDKAVCKAEGQLSERLAIMNEVRDQLKDQAATFATRESVDRLREQVLKDLAIQALRISELEKGRANDQGRSWMLWAILGTALTLLSIGLRFIIP